MTYILLDIGGTKTRVAVSKDLKTLDQVSKFDTPIKFKAGIDSIVKAIESMGLKSKVSGIAIGMRGRINEDKTALENDNVLSDWAKKTSGGNCIQTF